MLLQAVATGTGGNSKAARRRKGGEKDRKLHGKLVPRFPPRRGKLRINRRRRGRWSISRLPDSRRNPAKGRGVWFHSLANDRCEEGYFPHADVMAPLNFSCVELNDNRPKNIADSRLLFIVSYHIHCTRYFISYCILLHRCISYIHTYVAHCAART